MSKTLNYRAAIDNAGVMTRLSIFGTVLSAIAAFLVLILGVVKSSFAGSDVFAVGVVPYAIATIFGIAAILCGMFSKGAAIEEEEKALLAKRRDNTLLVTDEDARFTRQRTLDNYTHYAPYVLALLGAVIIVVINVTFLRYWNVRIAELKAQPANPMYPVFLSAVMAVAALFAGAFFNGQSREAAFRWLRPCGAWLIAGAISSAVAAVAGLLYKSGIPRYESMLAKILLGIYFVLAAELLLSFVVEFYRPRTLEEERPIFESRILALFTEPGGVMRNFANMLDYQFGFKVSATWVYSFVERAIFPLILVWALLLWGSTSIHEVNPNEVGLRYNFGKRTQSAPLKPGIYFTLPWPFGSLDKYSCDTIYEVTIGHSEEHEEEEVEEEESGHSHKPKKPKEDHSIVLWTAEHGEGNNNFIVVNDASEEDASVKSGEDNGKNDGLGDFYFVGLSMPVQYRLRPDGVLKYVDGSVDTAQVIKDIGQMVVTEYLASAPFRQVITDGRRQAQNVIQQRIQAECDKQDLGVEIVSVNLVGIHPPTQVGVEFQKVLGAMEEKEKMVLAAQQYKKTVLTQAESDALAITESAQAKSNQTATVSKAISERFLKQRQAYEAMPQLFMLNNYLNFLETDCRDVRKYILSSSLKGDVYDLNLEEKERINLFDSTPNE